jgi:Mrp family chromosome partitioning ATPase
LGWTLRLGFFKDCFMEALIYRATTGLIGKQRGVQRLSALARMVSDTPELREAYDALFGALRLSAAFNSGNSVLVTSTQPNEGKTTFASCLAITASLAGYSVLLVDGDLRRPWLAPACPASAPMRQIGRVEEGRISGSS